MLCNQVTILAVHETVPRICHHNVTCKPLATSLTSFDGVILVNPENLSRNKAFSLQLVTKRKQNLDVSKRVLLNLKKYSQKWKKKILSENLQEAHFSITYFKNLTKTNSCILNNMQKRISSRKSNFEDVFPKTFVKI